MSEGIVRRWARYRHERLYVEDAGGVELGYFDVRAGRYHDEGVDTLPILESAFRDHHAAGTVLQQAAPPAPVDLAANPPGEAARERAVGKQLGRLGRDWRVLHAVRVGQYGADIDHVVIGPGGVFTVNAKHHPHARVWVGGDTFMVNGQRAPYVRNSRYEARRVSRLLTGQVGFPVSVVGVVAVIGAHKGFTVKCQPEDGAVTVLRRRRISQHLAKLPPCLDARDVDAIYQTARRSTTWQQQ